MPASRSPKRDPLTVIKESSQTMTSDSLTTAVTLHFRGKGVRVVGRRWSVDSDEEFFNSGSITEAAELWEALETAASEGGVNLPGLEVVVQRLQAVDPNWAKALASLEDDDKEEEFDPVACPYCGKLGQQCEQHLLVNIDATFGEAWGPASGLFRGYVNGADGEEGDDVVDTSERIHEFVRACDEVALCYDHYAEGGPGMSSHEYWCWSEDPARDLKRLKRELGLPE